jgi:hypothetical protein
MPAGLLVTRPLPTTTTANVGFVAAVSPVATVPPPDAPVTATAATAATLIESQSLIRAPLPA